MIDDVIRECEYIQFPVGDHGEYLINTKMLCEWNKTALKKLVNDIVNDYQITFEEKCLLLQEIEGQLMHDFTQYKEMYERFGIKKYQGIAKRCIEVAEICRVNGRDKYV